ncbi:MAG TPA: Holliday junction branch migration protein RuvA [Firmicutes bacterium]|nr:Holliday junction branch migration protein RuvA [Bacillota bacterium]
MIELLRGRVARLEPDRVILDVGGVGYSVYLTSPARARLRVGEEASLFTCLQVRQDALQLYGFLRWEEKEAFQALLKVTGVGPKVALGILSTLSARDLVVAVACGDVQSLTSVSGVGKKTAQRLILELKEQMGAVAAQQAEEDGVPVLPAGGESAGAEAVAALMVLGYSAVEASKAVAAAAKTGATATPDLIREALKQLA